MLVKTETFVGIFMLSAILIFIYMSFKIGLYRLDNVKYAKYSTYFKDVSHLREKADVSIAGVRVGWVQKIHLLNFENHVRVDVMVDRKSFIYSDSYAIIRQDGLLGTKYIEINPGNALNPILPPGSTLMIPNQSPVAIDELLSSFKEIANNVQEVTNALKHVVAEKNNENNLSHVMGEIKDTFTSIKEITQKNDEAVTSLINDLSKTVSDLRDKLPSLVTTLQESVSKASNSFEETSLSLRKALVPFKSISKKLNTKEGVIGTLINDPSVAEDFTSTVSGIKKYFNHVDRISLDVDTHVESMQAPGNDIDFKDAKGYMNFVVKVADDLSYVLGLTSAYSGVVRRKRTDTMWLDQEKHPMVPDLMTLDNWAKLFFAPVKEEYVRDYSAVTYNIQFAKEIGRLQFRTGLFENSFGLGLDYSVLLKENVKWYSTFEIFRFEEFMSQTLGGRMVFDIDLPHLKWFNKVFFNDSCYFVFGADDFISKFNRNFFVGMGFAFEQNDLKYVLGKVK